MNSFLPMAQDCSQVPVDGKRSLQRGESYGVYDGHLTELNAPVSSEIKNGQWLGVEVKSQGEGGKVIGKLDKKNFWIRDWNSNFIFVT